MTGIIYTPHILSSLKSKQKVKDIISFKIKINLKIIYSKKNHYGYNKFLKRSFKNIYKMVHFILYIITSPNFAINRESITTLRKKKNMEIRYSLFQLLYRFNVIH